MLAKQQKMEPVRTSARCSIYPEHPPGTRVIYRTPADVTALDQLLVASSSLFVVGAVAWLPAMYIWAWRRWKAIPIHHRKRRATYAAILFCTASLISFGPHLTPRFARWIRVRKWKLWTSWLKFIAMEVVADQDSRNLKQQEEQAVLAFVPHGIFPFAFAFGVLPEIAQKAFGVFRPVVATATNFLPVVRDFLLWLDKVDASRPAVDAALSKGDRIGIVPGGIAEMFEGYPKQGAQPNDEYSIVRKGFLRMALRHGVPVVPIYCFGSTKLFRRLDLPLLEALSTTLRASLVVFFGRWGLPIPFRQRLLYVMGNPITVSGLDNSTDDDAVNDMHRRFCTELLRIFDRHKDTYGWGHKTLRILER